MNALVLLLALASPAEEAPSVAPIWLSKARSPKTPKRIVTVAPALTELLFALGRGDVIVGVSRFDDYPKAVEKLPKVGGFLDPNVEAIIARRPDLVLAVPNAGNRTALERVAALGVPVYVVPGNTFADIFTTIRAVGQVTNTEERATKLATSIRVTVDDLLAKTKKKRRPRVVMIYSWNPLIVAGPKSFADTVVDVTGGTNIATTGSAYPSYAIEKVVEAAPEVIIDATEVALDRPPWKTWTSVPAVKSGRVHRVTMGGFMRPGPRIIDGLRQMHALLHPN